MLQFFGSYSPPWVKPAIWAPTCVFCIGNHFGNKMEVKFSLAAYLQPNDCLDTPYTYMDNTTMLFSILYTLLFTLLYNTHYPDVRSG